MNRDELIKHIINGDRESLCRQMAPLNESQRESLAADAVALFQLVEKYSGPAGDDRKDRWSK